VDFIWALWQDCNDYDGSGVSSFSDEYDDNINFQLQYAPISDSDMLDFDEPKVVDTFDLANYDVSYGKGEFFINAGVDKQDNCNKNIDGEWFYDESDALKADAVTSYDESGLLAECAAIEGTVQERGIACCELVQEMEGGVCEKSLLQKDLSVHPQTGEPWPRDAETGDIIITLEEMTSEDYGLADCCLAMRSKMYAWALEMHQLEDVQMGCYDPYCNLADVGQEGYVCFNLGADEDDVEPQTLMATVSRALTSVGGQQVSVGGAVLLGSVAVVAVLMAKQCMGRGEYKSLGDVRSGYGTV